MTQFIKFPDLHVAIRPISSSLISEDEMKKQDWAWRDGILQSCPASFH